MLTISGTTRVYWTGRVWHVQLTHALSSQMVDNIIAYLRPIQLQRWRSLPPGDLKDDCLRSLRALDKRKIVQVFTGPGEKVLHDAYTRSSL